MTREVAHRGLVGELDNGALRSSGEHVLDQLGPRARDHAQFGVLLLDLPDVIRVRAARGMPDIAQLKRTPDRPGRAAADPDLRPRRSNGTPMNSYSSLCQPTPTPRRKRPPLSSCSVATSFARCMGLCSGTSTIEVPRPIRPVQPAIQPSVTSGSYTRPYWSTPSGPTMMCSVAQTESKPSSSASSAVRRIASGLAPCP